MSGEELGRFECECGSTYDTEQGLIVHQRQWCDLYADDEDENGVPPERDDAKPIDEVYRDRNLLACALVASNVGMGGWTPADDADSDEWAIVWIETPMGQCSWHVPRAVAESLLHRDDQFDYDGHDRPAKNDRLASWTQEGAWR